MRSAVYLCVFLFCAIVFAAKVPRPELYGISFEPSLVGINVKTGNATKMGPALAAEAQAQGLSVIDPLTNMYYLVGYNLSNAETAVVGISLADGLVKTELPLPFEQSAFVGVGMTLDFDPSSGNLFAVGREKAIQNNHRLVRINPVTKTVQNVASFAGGDLLGGAAAFDPNTHTFWTMFVVNNTINVYAYNTYTGKLEHQLPNTNNMDTLNWDPKTGNIFSVGLQIISSTEYKRILCKLDPRTATVSIVSEIPGYFIISASVSAFDAVTRTLYVQMQPSGKDFFNLVGVNVDTGKIASEAYLCADDDVCPWSMAHLNAKKL
eukprot:TRINITY_DN14456_c0_g1_i1.p1 TRINITY_DN14456_c0_g1~~TRINITY_DN14456_c0_g1_i1.p1  ORF type:complete len:321 (-),score=72.71 TRINITY_DN14456_c0_g1_i1:132-1094(-)